MPNPHRGEIEACLDGQPFSLCLTLGALAELEHSFGHEDMLSLADRFQSGRLSAAVEEARRLAGRSGRVATADLPLVLEPEHAARTVETWLFEAWAARERAQFALPPSRLALEPGDVVTLATGGRSRLLRITEIGEHGVRDIEARGIDPEVYAATAPAVRRAAGGAAVVVGQPLVLFLDLPLLRGDEPAHAGTVAAAQNPWPGGVAFYRSPESSGFLLKALVRTPAVTGVTHRSGLARRHLPLRARQHLPRPPRPGQPRLGHRHRPARRRQHRGRPQRRRRMGGAAVRLRRPHRAIDLPAVGACCAARPAPSLPCARPSPPAPASSCSTARPCRST